MVVGVRSHGGEFGWVGWGFHHFRNSKYVFTTQFGQPHGFRPDILEIREFHQKKDMVRTTGSNVS